MFKDNLWLIHFIFYVLIKTLTCILWVFPTLMCQPKATHQELQCRELSEIWNTENTCLSKSVIKVSEECVFPGGCVKILNSLLEDSYTKICCFMDKIFKISVFGAICVISEVWPSISCRKCGEKGLDCLWQAPSWIVEQTKIMKNRGIFEIMKKLINDGSICLPKAADK